MSVASWLSAASDNTPLTPGTNRNPARRRQPGVPRWAARPDHAASTSRSDLCPQDRQGRWRRPLLRKPQNGPWSGL